MPASTHTFDRPVSKISGGSTGLGGTGGGGGDGAGHASPDRIYRTGIWVAIAPVLMLFAAFVSAYIVRRGLSDDWQALDLPSVLWWNTGLLLGSSVALELARRCLAGNRRVGFQRWWSVASALGVAFLVGQIVAWVQLVDRGVYVSSNPSSSFFYLLTMLHAVHVVAGVAGLLYVAVKASRMSEAAAPRTAVDVATVYWHFLDGLWVGLFLLLLLWR